MTLHPFLQLPNEATPQPPDRKALLTPTHAWRVLCRRTGAPVSRTTFYRWLDSGKIYSVRMGQRLYVPWQTIEDVIRVCLEGR